MRKRTLFTRLGFGLLSALAVNAARAQGPWPPPLPPEYPLMTLTLDNPTDVIALQSFTMKATLWDWDTIVVANGNGTYSQVSVANNDLVIDWAIPNGLFDEATVDLASGPPGTLTLTYDGTASRLEGTYSAPCIGRDVGNVIDPSVDKSVTVHVHEYL